MTPLILHHINRAKLPKEKLHHFMYHRMRMIILYFLNLDSKVAISEELFKFMNTSMTSFLNPTTTPEAILNGFTSVFQIQRLVKIIDLISSILLSLTRFIIMV